jgi:DNA topoisomerase I
MARRRLARDPIDSARAAGLRYVHDRGPGIGRAPAKLRVASRPSGAAFVYVGLDGRRIRDRETLARIRALAIPPAWRDVWICPEPNGHLQATGRDARGRKQYRYHPRWRAVRDDTKYARLIAFAGALPEIRARVAADLKLPGHPRAKVLAAVVSLLEATRIRVGNEEYARANGSYGLTTLRCRHVDVEGATLSFEFRGKSGRLHRVELNDRRLARIVERCQEIPGQELFQYLDDDGERRTVDSGDVNAYLREVSGEDFTAKDFRTWAGTVLAARALAAMPVSTSAAQARRNVLRAVEHVAGDLGNTPAVCRKGYIHPGVIDTYVAGELKRAMAGASRRSSRVTAGHALRPDERAVLAVLQRRLRAARAA